jgi:hypothetical protein
MGSAKKVAARRALSLLMSVWASACSRPLGQKSECEKHIAEEIHVGVPVGTANTILEKCGFKTETDAAKHTLYGDKRTGGLIIERTQVVVQIDSDGKVAKVTVTKSLTGP